MQQLTINQSVSHQSVPGQRRDAERGRWTSEDDFICACIGSAFKLDVFPAFMIFLQIGFVSFLPSVFYLTILVVPLILIQTFIGQFSGTGFISALRICPLFKGIGYLSLALNLISAAYSIIFAAVPFFYFLNSFQHPLPWNCNKTEINFLNQLCGENGNDTSGEPAVKFLRYEMGLLDGEPLTFSWTIFLCGSLIWIFVGFILCNSTETIGLFFRWSMIVLFWLLFFCLGRFMTLRSAWLGVLKKFFDVNLNIYAWIYSPFIFLTALGPGWGTIISLSSYNHFKSNISRNSWLIAFGQLSMVMMLGLLLFLASNHFNDAAENFDIGSNWLQLLWGASALISMDLANFWCILYFAMLTLAGAVLLLVQIFAVLTALFDEFEQLRVFKRKVTLGLISALAVLSIIFYTNIGFNLEPALALYVMLGNIFLSFLLILAVMWVFGRERFQRDFSFMTGGAFTTWKVYGIRLITSTFVILTGVLAYIIAFEEMHIVHILVILPWLVVPFYNVYLIRQNNGSFLTKIKELAKPSYWYPVDKINFQRYEEALAASSLKS